MAADLAVEITKQAGETLRFLVWPIVLLGLVRIFRPQLAAILDNAELTAKAGGVELAIKKAASISASLAAASAKQPAAPASGPAPPDSAPPDSAPPGAPLSPAFQPAALAFAPPLDLNQLLLDRRRGRELSRARILWVDDNPSNNINEIKAFEELNITVETSKDNTDALQRLAAAPFDLVITDLTRGADRQAGLKLIGDVIAQRPGQRIIVYAGAASGPRVDEARRLGAAAATNSPRVLFDTVVRMLSAGA